MPQFLVQWKFTATSFESLRKYPLNRYATSVKLAEAFKGSIVCMYNRIGEYDGLGIFNFPDVITRLPTPCTPWRLEHSSGITVSS